MKKYKYINTFPKPFLEDLVHNRCLPIIGAGFSKNANIPKNKKMMDWDELGRAFADCIEDYKYTNALDAISAYSYEYSRTNLIEKLTELLNVNHIKPDTTHKAFCDLQFDIVCTTNFEFLLEDGYSLIPKFCKPILDENQLSINNSFDAVILLKIHGDLHHPNKLVVTEEDYDHFLNNNPLLSTYLANLLITRTPLFIGYSLDDTDFRQIWQIIKDRLGCLRRLAYVLKINCSSHEKARYERRGVKVINIQGDPADYPRILEDVFIELKDYWHQEILKQTTMSEEATLAEFTLPDETNNRLCFFSTPLKILPFYKKYIFPIAQNYGLVPISADDVITIGDNWMAKASALIAKSEFVVLDLSSQNTFLELGMLLNENKLDGKFLLIKSEDAPIPFELKSFLFLERSDNPYDSIDDFISSVNDWFQKIVQTMKPAYDEEPRRLLSKKEYRAAIISAITLLEITIRQAVENEKTESLKIMSPNSLYRTACDLKIITKLQLNDIVYWQNIRNMLVHTDKTITGAEAKKIVNGTYLILERIQKK